MISVGEICDRLRDDVDALARHLLPNARQEGNYLKVGSIAGEPGGSLAIYLAGERKGRFEDFAGDDHGDMLDLIQAVERLASKGDAVAWAKRWLSIEDAFTPDPRGPSPEERKAMAEEARRRAAERQAKEAQARESKIRGARSLYLHARSVPIADTPADFYLRGRMLEPAAVKPGAPPSWPGALRFHPEVYHGGERCKLPAMLAPIYLADGTHVATHRTFLQHDAARGWTKIDAATAKMVLGPLGGGFIPINKGSSGKPMSRMPAGEKVFGAEGIEDALVVRMARPGARIVAGVTLGNLGAMVFPEAARELVLCADRDDNAKAQAALERAIARQQARGLSVSLVMPPVGHKDLNDWLRALMRQAGAA